MPTVGPPIDAGGFSLTELCGCGSDCTDCCLECCTGVYLPETIHATVAGAYCFCVGADYTVALVYNAVSGKWEGTHSYGGCAFDITLKFYCSGPNCSDMRLDYSFSDSCNVPGTMTPSATCTCDPLDVVFTPAGVLGACCAGLGIPALQVEVTL